MANYLITGAAGFIASRVAEMLVETGHSVLGVDNMNDAYDVRMKEYRLERLKRLSGFRYRRVDISNLGELSGIINQSFDAIINLAARAGVRQSVENPWVYESTNVVGTLNLLELARRNGVAKLLLASSSSVYGLNAPLPTPETADSDHPLQAYAASKKGAEVLCHAYHHLYGIDVSVVRFFTVYGPAGRPDMVMFRLCQWISEGRPVKINGNGEQSRGFTYCDDIARGVIQALKPLGYEIINLGGHETITINALITLFEGLIGKKAQVEYGPANPTDMLANQADTRKARSLLGWEPRVSLLEGVTRLVEWYNMERSWASQINT